jgi:hypothetical protein
VRKAESGTAELADELNSVFDSNLQATLDREIDALDATQLSVFEPDRRVLELSRSDPRFLEHSFPEATTLMRVNGESFRRRRTAQ